MNFAKKKYKNEPIAFCEIILFTNESEFEIFGVKKPPKSVCDKCVAKTVKHGGDSLMVWGCMTASGVGKLVFIESTMRKEDYLNIVQQNVTPSVEKLDLGGK